jgi:hypothetical protein
VLARKGDGRWFVARINGEDIEKDLTLDLSSVPARGNGSLIADGNGLFFEQQLVALGAGKKLNATLKPRGGFVGVMNPTR